MGNLKVVVGEFASIDTANRKITVQDADKTVHGMFYLPKLDGKIAKQKVGYYNKFTLEGETCTDLCWAERPAGFPRVGRSSGGRGGYSQPRNEKVIVAQVALKVAGELFKDCGVSSDVTFEQRMAIITTAAIKATDEIMTACGGA